MVAPQNNRQEIYRKGEFYYRAVFLLQNALSKLIYKGISVKQIKMYSAEVLPKICVWAQSLGSDFAYRS